MNYNTQLFDFNDFFQSDIQKNILDHLLMFQLISDNQIKLSNKHTKQIITDFVCFHLTKKLQTFSIDKSICIVQPYVVQNLEIENYCSIQSIQKFLRKLLLILQKKFKNQIYIFNHEVDLKSSDLQFLIFHKTNQN